ncbi:MAG: hypothetical protein HYY14_04375 [Candidatus Omnitrophica bacterium]|nr:hypothetical protein [Candidatus Omnitrophota bacterium]
MQEDWFELLKARETASYPPKLLFYRFRGPVMTIGRHTHKEEVYRSHEGSRLKERTVRRATGGGAIFHAGGMCYSWISRGKTTRSGRNECVYWLRDMLLATLEPLGILGKTRDPRPETRARTLGSWCAFEEAETDLIIGHKKLGGMAQRLFKDAILIEGYLTLRRRETIWMERIAARGILEKHSARPVSLEELAGRPVHYDEIVSRFMHISHDFRTRSCPA